MPERYKLYLDQMFGMEIAQALRDEGHDILRASEIGQARADDRQILQKAISEAVNVMELYMRGLLQILLKGFTNIRMEMSIVKSDPERFSDLDLL